MAKKKKDKLLIIILIVIGAVILAGGVYLARDALNLGGNHQNQVSGDMFRVELFNGNYLKISDSQQQMFAVVNDIQTVRYARFYVNTANTGDIEYNIQLKSAEPNVLATAFHIPLNQQTVTPNSTYTWTSDFIDVNQYANTSTVFKVYVEGAFTNGHVINKSASLTLTVQLDAQNNTNVSVNAGGGGSDNTSDNQTTSNTTVVCTAGVNQSCTTGGCAGTQTCSNNSWNLCIKTNSSCGIVCVAGNTQSCTTNGCAGTQTCTNNAWGSCVKTDSSCGTDVCTGVQCRPYCTGNSTVPDRHYKFGGYCRIITQTDTATNVTTQTPKCMYLNISFYDKPNCGYNCSKFNVCGDGCCQPTECCYVPTPDEMYKCKDTATICTVVDTSTCNADCMQPQFAAAYYVDPLVLS
jgi:hypothetical protein